ncbi:MAG: ATP-binding protein [Actinomycetota bacterium]|nr:ATP-binding protein [Actinomycetota bacterium]
MALNPFIWDRPLDDPSKIVGMDAFANNVALTLKGQTNVALFGPRDTGKTTFTNQLALELAKTHGDDAPPFDVVKINLQRVVSIPGFIGCVHDAMTSHPVKSLRRAAQRQIGALEKEIGFDIRVIKGSLKRSPVMPEQDAETLHAQLVALRSLSQHLVVVFDEFQRLRHCPGDPLSVIRSALMSSGANHVSLLFTGSIRNAMRMMLEDSDQPIFGEAVRMQLPSIDRVDFLEYLDFQFDATGKPAEEQGLEHLLNLTRSHPRSTQQLAWETWTDTPVGGPAALETVMRAHDRLVQSIERSEFASVLNVLVSGDEGEVNEVRALQLLADRGGDTITSRPLATRYGFSSHSRVRPALVRLQGRGLVDERDGSWYIVDPLFNEWLRRSSPLADRPMLAGPGEG